MSQVYVGRVEDFADDVRKGVQIDGREVFVFEHKGKFFAYENHCPHAGGPVGEGTIIGKVQAVLSEGGELLREEFSETEFNIVCPWHGYEYDIETGACAGDKRIKLRKYRALVQDGEVYVSE